jgi:hypothetical protein
MLVTFLEASSSRAGRRPNDRCGKVPNDSAMSPFFFYQIHFQRIEPEKGKAVLFQNVTRGLGGNPVDSVCQRLGEGSFLTPYFNETPSRPVLEHRL